ncbi:MAG: DNA (cytosine-5-)-methyltransferase [Mycoplasmataceae bacterium]|nr:DNA (cytosine-5-)-methyltransferase [Mycoplasmataceae bacterium]
MKKYKALSLFSGAGGDTLGMNKAGIKVTHFVEFDSSAIKTHFKNFKNSKQILSLNNSTSIIDIEDSVFEKLKGKIDIIFAGFPCQGFSSAGKKIQNDDRNKLFYEFVRVVKIIQPRWIIGENVKGLLEKRKNWTINFADLINKEFENIGYKMHKPELIDVSDYGIPQLRKRVFFVGNNVNIDYVFPKTQAKKRGIRNIIIPSLQNAIKININNYPYLSEANKNNELNWIEIPNNEIISGSPHPWLKEKIKDREISWDVRKSPTHVQLLNLDKPSKTIHGGYVFQPRLFVLAKKNKNFYIRELNVYELKQLQSFPKNFDFNEVSKTQAIKQIGNAVPCEIVKKIINEIKKQDIFFVK